MASKQNPPNSTGKSGRRAAKRNKKRTADASEEEHHAGRSIDEDDDESDDDADMLQGNQQVQVDFDVREPQAEDINGIVSLLRQSFPSVPFSLTDLAASLVQNRNVGNVLVAVSPSDDDGDDEETGDVNFDDVEQIMGITTIAKLASDTKLMKDIRNFIGSSCAPNDGVEARKSSAEPVAASNTPDAGKRFTEILSQNTCGLLINERLINIPASVVAPLFQQLKTDYEDAIRANKWSTYTHFVYFIKMYRVPTTKTSKTTVAENKSSAHNPFEFVVEEDELISQAATCYVDYNISQQHAGAPSGGKWSSDKEMVPYRRVCLLEVNKFWALLPELERLKTELGNINITPMEDDDDEEYADAK